MGERQTGSYRQLWARGFEGRQTTRPARKAVRAILSPCLFHIFDTGPTGRAKIILHFNEEAFALAGRGQRCSGPKRTHRCSLRWPCIKLRIDCGCHQ
jgi:hypothetical protein